MMMPFAEIAAIENLWLELNEKLAIVDRSIAIFFVERGFVLVKRRAPPKTLKACQAITQQSPDL